MYSDFSLSWPRAAALAILTVFTISGAAGASPMDDADTVQVHIQAGDVTLGATLYRPAGVSGDLPVIVTAHGSAPSTRDGVGYYTNLGLRMGYAVLSFDKRGTGESTGEYEAFSIEKSDRVFRDLAADVAWSVRWVAQQDGIDAGRIGLLGGSQAGWIMPLATQLLAGDGEPEIAFIVIGEGVSISAGEEGRHEEILRELVDEHCMSSPPENSCALQTTPDRQMIETADLRIVNYDGALGYDPRDTLLAISTPTLWVFGLSDYVIPVTPSIDRLGALIRDDGKTNNQLIILPFGDHNFTNVVTGARYDLVELTEPWLDSIGMLPEQ
ncbi:alpha/beta hydrolase family protein [Maricaulis sp.]|uniref:alpha/beta hydrolase family protein n=1 Tax=Maricaulis sp. TaxID=1486257 RepID=UPI003A947282